MKITRARIYLVKIAGRHPVLVELDTDEGGSGVGDAAIAYRTGATAAAGMIKDRLDEIVLGKDPFRIDPLWGEMYDGTFWAKGGGPTSSPASAPSRWRSGTSKAGPSACPSGSWSGRKTRDEVRVYAHGWSFRAVRPDDFARAAEKVVKDGYDALKMYPLARPVESSPHGNIKHIEGRQIDRAVEGSRRS